MMSPVLTAEPALSGPPLLSVAEALDCEGLMRSGLDPESAGAVADCARWTTTYPLQKVKKRHREEAICPMMAPALAARSVYFSVRRVSDREMPLESLDTILREAAAVFEEKVVSPDPRLRCLVLVLPGVRGGRLLEATDPARAIKNELLQRGILVGEFFPGCPFATTFNPRLFALRSPAPMYVLRSFIESDWRFICQIPAWQRTYRARFGEPPAKLRHLGGPLWRLRQRISWRIDAVKKRFFPSLAAPVDLES
jgi:hypothetical protein